MFLKNPPPESKNSSHFTMQRLMVESGINNVRIERNKE